MQERGDHSLFVQAALGREIEDVDAAKFVIRSVPDQRFHGRDRFRVGRLSHDAEQTLGSRFAHGAKSTSKSGGEKPVLFGSGRLGEGCPDRAGRAAVGDRALGAGDGALEFARLLHDLGLDAERLGRFGVSMSGLPR